jgi:hypothetical protein
VRCQTSSRYVVSVKVDEYVRARVEAPPVLHLCRCVSMWGVVRVSFGVMYPILDVGLLRLKLDGCEDKRMVHKSRSLAPLLGLLLPFWKELEE